MNHYFHAEQDSDLRITTIERSLRGNRLTLHTGSGVFSVGRVDKGSELLIERSEIPAEGRILDLGCGYGVIGIAIAKAFEHAQVLMTDVNSRAVALAMKNLKQNKIPNATAVMGDGFSSISGDFDCILLNPPQSAGKKLCLKLMRECKGYLRPGGSLQAVMRHQIGGKDMSEKVMDTFGSMEVLAIRSGYRIYKFMA